MFAFVLTERKLIWEPDMRFNRLDSVTIIAATFFTVITTREVLAQSAGGNEAEITVLKQQLRMLEQKLDILQKQTAANTAAAANAKSEAKAGARSEGRTVIANAKAAIPIKGPTPPPEAIVLMPNNRPTICTYDQQNCIALTGRIHYDMGGYDYHPNTPATVPQRLDDGVNLRRARIGVIGKFMSDWNFALIYDFGGSSDGFASTASVGGTAVGFLPGGALSGVENAYFSYTGLKPFGGTLAVEAGVMDVLWSLDESNSSNDIPFMERSAALLAATNIAANDFRAAAGARWFNDRFWAGAYATGPTTGAIHSASSINPPGTTEQFGTVARVAGQLVNEKDYTLHVGGGAEFLIDPLHNLVANTQTLTINDRPELRIDPTAIVSTGAIPGVSGARVYSAEAAATYGPLYLQGEYFWFDIERKFLPNLPSVNFQGGYAEAAFALTGESRAYLPASSSYGGLIPKNPFSLSGGGWGAWEIALRYSTINLNDQLAQANGVAGGRQTIYTAALNWYISRNVRVLLDFLHGDITKQLSPTNFTDVGAKFDAVAMRTQVAF
jgi:phosphate-selective porin OprO/OprP